VNEFLEVLEMTFGMLRCPGGRPRLAGLWPVPLRLGRGQRRLVCLFL